MNSTKYLKAETCGPDLQKQTPRWDRPPFWGRGWRAVCSRFYRFRPSEPTVTFLTSRRPPKPLPTLDLSISCTNSFCKLKAVVRWSFTLVAWSRTRITFLIASLVWVYRALVYFIHFEIPTNFLYCVRYFNNDSEWGQM